MSRIALVTGTDTGVGKTFVACGLARALRSLGCGVAVRKPAETGCAPLADVGSAAGASDGVVGGDLFPADAAALAAASGGDESLAEVCGYRFAEPLAPAVAAERAGAAIDLDRLVRTYRERAREVDVLLVEGAGGLLVPLSGRVSFADLACALEARLVVVVGARLGAINHALLTIEAAQRRGLEVAALVVNHFAPGRDLATDTLAGSLGALAGVAAIASLAHGADAGRALRAVAERLAA